MIAIIDYDAGNIRSVGNALQRLGAEYELTADPVRILAADKVILPVWATPPKRWPACRSAACASS
jgi:imidazoleglycerol phosphate synthase glutamine amidotransferase subunit HisH